MDPGLTYLAIAYGALDSAAGNAAKGLGLTAVSHLKVPRKTSAAPMSSPGRIIVCRRCQAAPIPPVAAHVVGRCRVGTRKSTPG